MNAMQTIKFKFEYDLFACLIYFLSYLNGNMNYLNILPTLLKDEVIKSLKVNQDESRRNSLWVILTNYGETIKFLYYIIIAIISWIKE